MIKMLRAHKNGSEMSGKLEGLRGKSTSLDDLLPPKNKRWYARDKAKVVAALDAGIISTEDAMARYSLSTEELDAWQRLRNVYGIMGLRATRPPKKRSHSRDRGG
jgi:hypothetical protein